MRKKEEYEIETRCRNCGHKQTVKIPRGVEWHDAGWGTHSHIGSHDTFKPVECEHCGCEELDRMRSY